MTDHTLLRLSGIVFIGLLIAATVAFGELLGAFGDPDHVFEDYYGRPANRRGDIAGGYLLMFAALTFLVFSRSLQSQVIPEAGGAALVGLIAPTAILFSALLILAAAALMTVSFSIEFGESFGDDRPFSSAYVMIPQLGTVLVVVAAPMAAAAHIALIAAGGRQKLSMFVTWASFFCAFALLFSVLYLPLVALPAWVLLMTFGPRKNS